MNKLKITSILMLSSFIAFAQSGGERPGRFDSPGSGNFRNENFRNEIEPLDAPETGAEFVPIDDYQFLLLGLAVLLIAYFVYRSRQTQKV